MPEMRFHIQWPDGAEEICYSPSLVVKDYLAPGTTYPLEDFVARSRTALTIASDRVQVKYGRPCGLALGQLRQIEATASRYRSQPQSAVQVLGFVE
ncbi:MAG: MSMEG_0570 family nitrogen starvation response protein [Nodosilinea sp.]